MTAARKLDIQDLEVKKPHQWLKHHGGSCPVLPEVIVSVRFRNGDLSKHTYAARQLRWHRLPGRDTPFDVVAFKIVEASE